MMDANELDVMRRALAYATEMPNALNLPMSAVEAPVWGGYDGRNVYANTRLGSLCVPWRPDEDRVQCGMVVEAMWEKGWADSVYSDDYPTITALWWRNVEKGMPSQQFYAEAESECEARMLAAAHALDADND